MDRMPVVFSGHGSPMLALADDGITRGLREVGERIVAAHGKPEAILAVSGHWYTNGLYTQSEQNPRQVYDMYGFPRKLYEVKYPVAGCAELTERVTGLLGNRVSIDDSWGIDHGTWTVLVHMFPKADVPVVQLSVDASAEPSELVELGRALAPLREEGYLVFGSGNVVHNLSLVQWDNPGGTSKALRFNELVVDAVLAGETDKLARYNSLPDAAYAVPTPDHYLPLLYCLGAAGGDAAEAFNNTCNLGSMAMTGFVFGM